MMDKSRYHLCVMKQAQEKPLQGCEGSGGGGCAVRSRGVPRWRLRPGGRSVVVVGDLAAVTDLGRVRR